MLPQNYVPILPFPDFKWKWASVAPTESINDPVVLIGVLFRMRKLELLDPRLKYSSEEFAKELRELYDDVKDSIDIDLEGRGGERNLIRNSGQYWRAVRLIDSGRTGRIVLTDFGRRVADHDISQTEFAAITIQSFKLPNTHIQSAAECQQWIENGLTIFPLRLILSTLRELHRRGQGFLTTEELIKVVIPLSANKVEIEDYVNFVLWFRAGYITLIGWPNCVPSANDPRIAREYLLFLSHYGYLIREEQNNNMNEQYSYNHELDSEISAILADQPRDGALAQAVENISAVASDIERKRVEIQRINRPNQARFRKDILEAYGRCIITNVMMPEVLEAAHIKPFKYNGEDTVANGFPMRMDIHLLFDAGHLRISDAGEVHLSTRARMDYGATVPPQIYLPEFTSREFLRWRWDNYNGL